MNVISTQLVPPGGWKFIEGEYTFENATCDGLVKLIAEHRQTNGKAPGSPLQEVFDQIGEKNPQLLLNKEPSVAVKNIQKARSFAAALKNYILGGGALVDQNTANIRASICVSCHNNTNEDVSNAKCGSCVKAAQAGLGMIRAGILNGRKVPQKDKLKSCALCGCDINLKIWFPTSYFDPNGVEKNKWPNYCWMKE